MASTLRHRGPDDAGAWVDPKFGVALGHRRLAIVDLSAAGHQPMHSASGRYVISYNGEVYNFRGLARELEGHGHAFRGHSDTEVILAAIDEWGLEPSLERFNGMFAFALWDRRDNRLHLVRDRLGIKPLYYGWLGEVFGFASELKGLRAHPDFRGEIDRDVLALYVRHNYVPTPYSIYKGIYKLPPGKLLTVDHFERGRDLAPRPYWSAREAVERGLRDLFEGSRAEAVEELDLRLRDAVKLRMEADVPLGAFLSGGIDSSVVVALMQAQSARPVKTYSIGFSEESYNEAVHARAVAEHLGTEHTEWYVSPEEAMQVIPRLSSLYDEPFADSSQIPTCLVSELARRHVTVSLSGDGGDELFCGYSRYTSFPKIWNGIGWMPSFVRRGLGKALLTTSAEFLDLGFQSLTRYGHGGSPSDQLHRLAEVLATNDQQDIYLRLMCHSKEPISPVLRARERRTAVNNPEEWASISNITERMMYLDLATYLPDDLLTKVDRASMGVSLEARVPLLDHRVVEFAWRVPLTYKASNGQGKRLLREVLHRYVPPKLVERPKKGFGVPIDAWLRGPLRDWAEGLLEERRIREESFFNPTEVRRKWHQHLSGRRKWQSRLWALLMFEAWLETQSTGMRVPDTPAAWKGSVSAAEGSWAAGSTS